MKYILLATLAIISIKQVYTQNQSFNFEGKTLKYNAKYGFIKGGEVIISSKKDYEIGRASCRERV